MKLYISRDEIYPHHEPSTQDEGWTYCEVEVSEEWLARYKAASAAYWHLQRELDHLVELQEKP